jgi:hypothetical protein
MLMASLNDNALRKVICDINQLIGISSTRV